jgi:hypothetical protein
MAPNTVDSLASMFKFLPVKVSRLNYDPWSASQRVLVSDTLLGPVTGHYKCKMLYQHEYDDHYLQSCGHRILLRFQYSRYIDL